MILIEFTTVFYHQKCKEYEPRHATIIFLSGRGLAFSSANKGN